MAISTLLPAVTGFFRTQLRPASTYLQRHQAYPCTPRSVQLNQLTVHTDCNEAF